MFSAGWADCAFGPIEPIVALSRLIDRVLQQILPIIVIWGLGCLARATDQANGFASALGLSGRLSRIPTTADQLIASASRLEPIGNHSRLADCSQPIGAD